MAGNGVVAFVFARGGSKGLPGKNLRLFAGKPLIAHAIEHARAVPRIDRVIVSTDCTDIASVARDFGAEVPFLRPADLAADDSPEWLSWRHALNFIQEEMGVLPGAMVSVPVPAPLRRPEDIDRCLDLYSEGGVDVVVTVREAHRSPYFNMVQRRPDGTVALVIPIPKEYARRQDAPAIFDMTTIAYVADPEFVLSRDSIFQGRVKAVEIPPERAIDIDTLLDFEMAEFLRSRQSRPC
jgi:CMP-N-acetylneuraminic acid synthetase